jgi:hypothetical protein
MVRDKYIVMMEYGLDVFWLSKMWKMKNSTELYQMFVEMVQCCGVPRNFFAGGGGVQQIRLRTEDGENGDLGVAAPKSWVMEAAVIWYNKFHFI